MTTNRVQTRIFIGIHLPLDLKFHLNRSIDWKQAVIDHTGSDIILEAVRFHEVEYLGAYLNNSMLTLGEIKLSSGKIKERLKEFAPNFDIEALEITLFPQVFVS